VAIDRRRRIGGPHVLKRMLVQGEDAGDAHDHRNPHGRRQPQRVRRILSHGTPPCGVHTAAACAATISTLHYFRITEIATRSRLFSHGKNRSLLMSRIAIRFRLSKYRKSFIDQFAETLTHRNETPALRRMTRPFL
jgi:hypothetical protein